jgi:phage gp29-like protein
MTDGIWTGPNQFRSFGESVDRAALGEDIASRSAAWDWHGLLGLLPDPDPVLASLGDGVEVLERLTADGHLCSVIQTRKLGTLKKEFEFQPYSLKGEKPAPAAVKLRDQLVEDLERVDLYALISGILDAPLYGMTPIEIKYKHGKGRVQIKDLEVKPARWFGFNEQNEPRFISSNNPWDGEELPFGKFVFARHFPTYDNPNGLRLLSRCFWPTVFKKGGVKFWVVLAEKYGMPFLIGQYAKGTSPAEQQTMLSNLTKMVRDAVAVIPQGGSVAILEAKGSGKAEIHAGLIDAMNAEMSKVIMGQTLTADVSDKGGSYAAGKVHEGVLGDYRAADQKLVKTAMEEIAWIYGQINAPGVPTPSFTWYEEDDPKTDFAERDKTLGENGVKFTKSYYKRTYNLQDDDFEVTAETKESAPQAFTEGAYGNTPVRHTDAKPDTADIVAAKLSQAAQPAVEGMITQVKQLLDKATSLEEFSDQLLNLADDLDPNQLAELFAQALTLADLAGRHEVLNGH